MKIEVFGTGCPRCDTLEQVVRVALQLLGIRANVDKIADLDTIVRRGIDSTPALVVDGELVVAGRVPDLDEVRQILSRPRGR
ncbi:MAG: redox-active disulfide protein 2 [Euryarchaeota archaeon RBG_16_62_10]|nr:MAG: redox-active disulfide protein 2 [Euryarchaeota archaeon RBG_16_62_10]